MIEIAKQIEELLNQKESAVVHVQTLGTFRVWLDDEELSTKDWGRDKSIQLFQFLVTSRHRRGLHKEQIIDRIWEDDDAKSGQQNFKVALHGLNKALEPDKQSRSEARFIIRQGVTYQLNLEEMWIDVDALESFIALGNQSLPDHPELAREAYREALALYHGVYLPNRLYEDWSSAERERIQVLTLSAIISLAELLLHEMPAESIRLAQMALQIDNTWEEAYRIQMEAYFLKGNRPSAIKTYQQCLKVLDEEFGIEPLPETKALLRRIREI